MSSDDLQVLLMCLGFGFGSIFWPFLAWLLLRS